ncbi:Hypothetical protein DEACI_2428 [Acididesulfobacillus acetoxydans]|uniref:Uncharacterized protein n=1 Tax=Acididesulfobacillus acetoxydans TaxID=1561005 RepID=A0A8S0X5L6_9FIRM|nr:Hypothetical protein DEACI_2428 [Acididesulfobacillus acetoxydans]CEJ09021.1 Hypothetical protein DEACI_3504 [Acididesulfobacillus acetoxydans]
MGAGLPLSWAAGRRERFPRVAKVNSDRRIGAAAKRWVRERQRFALILRGMSVGSAFTTA